MSEPTDPVCPECDTPRASDGTPACSCARLASDARRDARTAEAAAAADFAPLRIRPFVELGDDAGAVGPAIVDEVPQEARDLEIPSDFATQGDAGDADGSPAAPALDAESLKDPPRKHRPLLIAGAGAAWSSC